MNSLALGSPGVYAAVMHELTESREFHEGTVTLPSGAIDRSTNIYFFGSLSPPEMSIVISRDTLAAGQSFHSYVRTVVQMVTSSLGDLHLLGIKDQFIVSGVNAHRVDFSWTHEQGHRVHQSQVFVPLDGERLLIVTASHAEVQGAPPGEGFPDDIFSGISLKGVPSSHA